MFQVRRLSSPAALRAALLVAASLASACTTTGSCPPCQSTQPGYAQPGPGSQPQPQGSITGGGPGSCPSTGAAVFDNDNFTGRSAALQPGRYDLAQLEALGIENDTIWSVCVATGCTATLYADAGFSGDTRALTGPVPALTDFGGTASAVVVSCP